MRSDYSVAMIARIRLAIFLARSVFRQFIQKVGIRPSFLAILALGLIVVYSSLSLFFFSQSSIRESANLFYNGLYSEKDGFAIAGDCDRLHDSKCLMAKLFEPYSNEVLYAYVYCL